MFQDAFWPSRTTPTGLIARLRGLVDPGGTIESPEKAAARRVEERRAAGAELLSLERQRDTELPKLATAEEKARGRLEALTPAYQEAVTALDRARVAHSRRAHDYAYGRQGLLRRIEIAAEPVIDEFMRDLNELFSVNLETPLLFDERNPYRRQDNSKGYEVWSNGPSIDARRIAILAARNQAEAMKQEPDQSDIRDRLVALVEALPDAGILVKVADR